MKGIDLNWAASSLEIPVGRKRRVQKCRRYSDADVGRPGRSPGSAERLERRLLLSRTLTTLYPFTSYAGSGVSAVAVDAGGNLFGTTTSGGAYFFGTIFELAKGSSMPTTLYSFTSGDDSHAAGIAVDAGGNLFGTAILYGTIFELAKGSGVLTILDSFAGRNDGAKPLRIAMDPWGNLFGTTFRDGDNGDGTVFELAKGGGGPTTLYSFSGGNDGAYPIAITVDAGGNLFGTTAGGGANGDGTVFELARGGGVLTTLYSFSGGNDGADPLSIAVDAGGNLFGTTFHGGANGDGTVFELAKGGGGLTTLYSFSGGNDGANPNGIAVDAGENLFGTTTSGGANGDGTIFELSAGSLSAAFSGLLPSRIVATGQLTPTLRLTNAGQDVASGSETMTYYLSTTPDLSGSPIQLGSTNDSLNLQGNGSVDEKTTLRLPSSAHPGGGPGVNAPYYLVTQLSGVGQTFTVASQPFMIVPKVVTIITPGFLVGPGGVFSTTYFDQIRNELDSAVQPGSALSGNTFSEVYAWPSTQHFAGALVNLALEELGPPDKQVYHGLLAESEGENATADLLASASSLFNSLSQNELLDKADVVQSGVNEQIINLIGHSRGADLNSVLAGYMKIAGNPVDSFISLDGFGSDWPTPIDLITDNTVDNINQNVQNAAINVSVNYTVDVGLFQFANNLVDNAPWISAVAQTFTGVAIGPVIDELQSKYPAMQAPTRPAFAFPNTVISGDGSNTDTGLSSHTNITQLFADPRYEHYVFFYPDGTPTYLQQHGGDPAVTASVATGSLSPQVNEPYAPLRPETQEMTASASALAAPAAGQSFRDGNFGLEGKLVGQPGMSSDPGVQALLNYFSNPTTLLSAMWDVSGSASLVQDGSNAGAQLTETANTSIGQTVVPTGNGTVTFNLTNITGNTGDQLQVLFDSQLLGSVTLQGAGNGAYSVPFTGVGTQAGELSFKLTGPTNAGASVTLEDLSVQNSPVSNPNAVGLMPTVKKSTLPGSLVGGSSVHGTVTLALTNTTSSTESGSNSIDLYLSDDGSIDGKSILIGQAKPRLKLKTGKSQQMAVSVHASSVPAGTYTLLAQTTDASSNVVASATGPTLTVAAPFIDLAPVTIHVPSSVKAGKKGLVQVTLINTGNIAANGSLAIDLQASADGTIDSTSIDLGTVSRHVLINPGKKLTLELSETFPLTGGPLYVVADVDQANTFNESLVSNNVLASGTSVRLK